MRKRFPKHLVSLLKPPDTSWKEELTAAIYTRKTPRPPSSHTSWTLLSGYPQLYEVNICLESSPHAPPPPSCFPAFPNIPMSENTKIYQLIVRITASGHHKTSGHFFVVPLFVDYLLSSMLNANPQRMRRKHNLYIRWTLMLAYPIPMFLFCVAKQTLAIFSILVYPTQQCISPPLSVYSAIQIIPSQPVKREDLELL